MSDFVTPPRSKKPKGKSISPRKSATNISSRSSYKKSINIRRYPHHKDIIYGINNSTGKIDSRKKVYTKKIHKSVDDKPERYNSKNEFVPQSKVSIIMEQYNRLTSKEKRQIQKDFDIYVNGTSPDTHATSSDNIFDKVSVFKHVDRNNPFSKDDMLFITFLQQKYNGLGNVPKDIMDKLLNKEEAQETIDEILGSEEYKTFYLQHMSVYDKETIREKFKKLTSNSQGGNKKRKTSKNRH
jgi:hypothetical protein